MITKNGTMMTESENSLIERDLKGLRIFRVAANSGGFSAAEQRLRMSRATISRRIKEVEEKLGTSLCTRGPQGFELTEAGKAVLRLTSEALDALERIKPSVDALRGRVSGDLAIGIADNAFSNPDCRVSNALNLLLETVSDMHLEVKTLPLTELSRALHERQIHIAIQGVHTRSPSLRYIELFDEHHFIYAPCDTHGLDVQLPLINRIGQPFITDALTLHGFLPGPDATGLDSIALLLRTGQYCGLLPQHYADLLPQSWGLGVVPGSPRFTVKFCAVTDSNRPLTPSGTRFLELLEMMHSSPLISD